MAVAFTSLNMDAAQVEFCGITTAQMEQILDKGENSEFFKKFLASGEDNINSAMVADNHYTVLRNVAGVGRLDLVKTLIAHKANVTQGDVAAVEASLGNLYYAVGMEDTTNEDREKFLRLPETLIYLREQLKAQTNKSTGKDEGKQQ